MTLPRYVDTRARKNYAGMAPITRAPGTKRVVLARYTRNRRLADALYQQAFSALSSSPGARAIVPGGNFFAAPNHYVQLQTMPFVSDTQEWVHLDTWSWARTWDGWQGSERFRSNYFGYLRATMS